MLKVEGFWDLETPFKHLVCENIEPLGHKMRFKKKVQIKECS